MHQWKGFQFRRQFLQPFLWSLRPRIRKVSHVSVSPSTRLVSKSTIPNLVDALDHGPSSVLGTRMILVSLFPNLAKHSLSVSEYEADDRNKKKNDKDTNHIAVMGREPSSPKKVFQFLVSSTDWGFPHVLTQTSKSDGGGGMLFPAGAWARKRVIQPFSASPWHVQKVICSGSIFLFSVSPLSP